MSDGQEITVTGSDPNHSILIPMKIGSMTSKIAMIFGQSIRQRLRHGMVEMMTVTSKSMMV